MNKKNKIISKVPRKEKRHFYVPEEFAEEYERDMRKKEMERINKESEEISKRLARTRERMNKTREELRKNREREKWIDEMKVQVDEDEIKAKLRTEYIKKIEQNIASYLIKNNAKKGDVHIQQLENGKIEIRYTDILCRSKKKIFTKEELYNMSFTQEDRGNN